METREPASRYGELPLLTPYINLCTVLGTSGMLIALLQVVAFCIVSRRLRHRVGPPREFLDWPRKQKRELYNQFNLIVESLSQEGIR